MKNTAKEFENISLQIRRDILEMIYKAGSGHPGGSLSAVELLVVLYFEILEKEDRFFLSNGHVCPALYSVMAEKGLIQRHLLDSYTELDSPLQGHPERNKLPGIEISSGSLGMGLAQAAGYATIKKNSLVFCMTSDGEHDEGSHWEAVNFAAKYKLSNLIQIVDKNGIQIEGTVEEIMPLGDLKEKYLASDWNVIEIDGHNFEEILKAFDKAKGSKNRPTVILAKTIFGKGVTFMEGNPEWHAKAPSEDEFKKGMEELK
jgi:transketolase